MDDDDELTELLRRAYAPDADIAGDPDALRRLDELLAHRRGSAHAEPESADAPPPTTAPTAPGPPLALVAPPPPASGADPGDQHADTLLTRALRKLTPRATIAIAWSVSLVVAAAIGATAVTVLGEEAHYDTVLHASPSASPLDGKPYEGVFAGSPATTTAYEPVYGIAVTAVRSASGIACILVAPPVTPGVAQPETWNAFGDCSPAGLSMTMTFHIPPPGAAADADTSRFSGYTLDAAGQARFPEGCVLRLVDLGDRIGVQIASPYPTR